VRCMVARDTPCGMRCALWGFPRGVILPSEVALSLAQRERGLVLVANSFAKISFVKEDTILCPKSTRCEAHSLLNPVSGLHFVRVCLVDSEN
jgi:hypothetical protein